MDFPDDYLRKSLLKATVAHIEEFKGFLGEYD
jgi:hypothetical protein